MLADRLRELRKYRHMTATHLAAAAGVSKSFISQLESGRTSASLATLARIATALDVPTGALLTSAAGSPDSIADGATAYDTSGPLRLVTMRARRTAARAR